MSGHSKWSQIKRSKGAKDAKKGQLFSVLAKRISLAAKAGGSSDPTKNFQLRTEIEKAKAISMPQDNIERAAKKPFETGASQLVEVVYEGYGPFATAFIVECATDNKNRTVSNIKHIFSKHGGALGSQGSVAWQFETKGQILVEPNNDSESLELAAIDAGALDVLQTINGTEVYTKPEQMEEVKLALAAAGASIADASIVKQSTQPTSLSEEQTNQIELLLNELEDNEDVVAVYSSVAQ